MTTLKIHSENEADPNVKVLAKAISDAGGAIFLGLALLALALFAHGFIVG